MLLCLMEEEKARWNDFLAHVVHAYNCTQNDATAHSPFFLMFRRHPCLPVDVATGKTAGEDYGRYVRELQKSLSSAYKRARARENANINASRNKIAYDRKARAMRLEIGVTMC